jgi:hypothetical protein
MSASSLDVEIGQMLSSIDLNPVQAALQGPNLPLLYEFVSDKNAVHYADRVGFEGYALQFSDETKGIVELEAIDKWGDELASMLYTYRSIARALASPQNCSPLAGAPAGRRCDQLRVCVGVWVCVWGWCVDTGGGRWQASKGPKRKGAAACLMRMPPMHMHALRCRRRRRQH